MTATFWLAAATYLVLTFVIAAGWHLVLFKNTYARLDVFTRQRPLIALGVSSMVLQALVFAYVYPRIATSGPPVIQGAIVGLLLGVFLGSNAVLAEAGKNEVGSLPTWLALESTYYLVQFALVGAAVGLVYA